MLYKTTLNRVNFKLYTIKAITLKRNIIFTIIAILTI